MKFLNKVFNGSPTDINSGEGLSSNANTMGKQDIPRDFNLKPVDEIAIGEPVAPIPSIIRATEESTIPPLPEDLEPELDYLDNYEQLRKAMDITDLYGIFNELETISSIVNELNKNEGKTDETLETWQPLLSNIEAFTVKRQALQNIEQQMKQTIGELQEIHQRMFDSIAAVRAYNKEREIMYAARKKLANELESKLLLLQDPSWLSKSAK